MSYITFGFSLRQIPLYPCIPGSITLRGPPKVQAQMPELAQQESDCHGGMWKHGSPSFALGLIEHASRHLISKPVL